MKLQKFVQQSTSHAAKESSKSKEAKALVKFIKDQLMEIKEKLPPKVSESETFKAMQTRVEAFLNQLETSVASSLPANSESSPMEGNTNASRSSQASATRGEGGKEITEQFEPGVYITYEYHNNGVKIFKRVRFSKRKFNEKQAGEWWSKNKDRVFMRYNPNAIKPASAVSSPTPPSSSSSSSSSSKSNFTENV